jgi:phosphoglycolate phosphatase-like HAD superfamily hydrolase
MKRCEKKLEELIKEVVMPDIEDHIDNIFESIANNKNASDEVKSELEEMHEMRAEFEQVLKDIENKELDKDECIELYEDIKQMIDENIDDECDNQ